ncbi:hypothetical protein C8R43DRAFT_1123683 [Mycena crocata]|nr:hypothetical protein C8R43DRAFT_1123683 [Mycena crocata]
MSVCEADRTRLAHKLEAKILELERKIAALRAETDDPQSRIDSYRYPVLTLPSERNLHPFLTTLSSLPTSKRTFIADCVVPPFHIARSNPEGKTHIPMECLARSCTVPLTIDIDDQDYDAPAECSQSLIPHRARWESLRIYDLPLNYLPHLAEPMPLPVHIAISCLAHSKSPTAVCDAPRLGSAVLDNRVAAVVLPWAQLTS